MTKDIGIKVNAPKEEPRKGDKKNPFNGTLPVRGKLFEGKVVKAKGKDTVVLQKEAPVYFSKFKRYGRSKNSIHAHVPSNLQVNEGDIVEIFGENLTVLSIAKSINTIPYEIYSTLNRRLKRVYSE